MIRRPPRSTLFPYTTLFRSLAPRPTLWVNKVLDWYGGDFGGPAGVKRVFFRYLLAHSAAEVLRPDVRIEDFDYDWTLNDTGAGRPGSASWSPRPTKPPASCRWPTT